MAAGELTSDCRRRRRHSRRRRRRRHHRRAAAAAVAAAATGTASAAVAAAWTAPTATAFTGGGLVDPDHPAHPLHVLEVIDGLLFGGIIGQFDEGETALATGFTVEGKAALPDLAVLAEEIEKVLAFGLEREVADVDGHSMKKAGTDSSGIGNPRGSRWSARRGDRIPGWGRSLWARAGVACRREPERHGTAGKPTTRARRLHGEA